MKVEQFVMAYKIEQDRIRALLPNGFESIRPVLRINTEIRKDAENESVYIELNTPVEAHGKRGWLNISHWDSVSEDISYQTEGKTVYIKSPFFTLSYTGVGIQGGCPAEKDNDGCFFLNEEQSFCKNETITEKKEFCDCKFAWHFNDGDARGKSIGTTLPAFSEEQKRSYEVKPFTAENVAAIPCEQVLGTYIVRFKR